MEFIAGDILTKDGFVKGYIKKDNEIVEIFKGNAPKKIKYKGLIIPSLINSHTHIGDSFIWRKNIRLPKKLKDLVEPPNGLKHKLLETSTDNEIINGMKKSLRIMEKSGINHFCDFREDGLKGIKQIKSALDEYNIKSTVLSRPKTNKFIKKELDDLLTYSNGIAISSISEWDYLELEKISEYTKKRKKIFSLHASEGIREDIDKIIDLKPNFLVHMTKATKADLILVKEKNIPIVICPRSNNYFGLEPNYKILKDVGIRLLIGTDNAMLNPPNILNELKFILSKTDVFNIYELLKMITINPRKVLNLECDILGSNPKANFIVLDKKTLKPLYKSY